MRLTNTGTFGKKFISTLLDDTNRGVNYIQINTGSYRDDDGESKCIKCFAEVHWLDWYSDNNKARAVCSCGEKQTLEILSFISIAKSSKE